MHEFSFHVKIFKIEKKGMIINNNNNLQMKYMCVCVCVCDEHSNNPMLINVDW